MDEQGYARIVHYGDDDDKVEHSSVWKNLTMTLVSSLDEELMKDSVSV